MSWKRGEKSTDVELSRTQDWIEFWDLRLGGGNGEGRGMYQEWQDYKSKIYVLVKVAVALAAVPGILLTLSALGVLHLR